MMEKWFKDFLKMDIVFIISIMLSLGFLSETAADNMNGKYSYTFNNNPIRLNSSSELVVFDYGRAPDNVMADNSLSGIDAVRDTLSETPMLKDKRMVIYRLPELPQMAEKDARMSSLKARARKSGAVYQPVFEQGQALLIPTAEILIGFSNKIGLEDARRILKPHMADLGIIDVKKIRKNTVLVTIQNSADGRCYQVCQAMDKITNIDFVEPNHMVVMLNENTKQNITDEKWASYALSGEMPSESVKQPSNVQGLAKGWHVLASLNGEENSFPPQGWHVKIGKNASKAIWGRTSHRSHSGRQSIYCSQMGPDGVNAPGPARTNMNTALFSPVLNLEPYKEVYVEAWFYAKNEIVKGEKGPVLKDYPSLIVVNKTAKPQGQYLAIFYTGDCTKDPTTDRGWRKVLYRVPPALRTNPAQVILTYRSNERNTFEGAYLDDIRIVASKKVDLKPPSNDDYSGYQYELNNTGQIAGLGNEANDMDILKAWEATDVSPSIVVAVIDDGVDLKHPDLNLVTGYNPDGTVGGGPYSDNANHGTSVAGNVGAIGKNKMGVIGTAPNVKIMPIRFGRNYQEFAQCIDLAVEKGAHIITNSWGWQRASSRLIENAIKDALKAGRTVLFAAGNGPDRPPFIYDVVFPGNLTGTTDVICVGATSQLDEHKSASSADGIHGWGSSYVGDGPDICSPGPWSYTTDRRANMGYNNGLSGVHPDYCHDFSGTSSSTPKVAGVVALMLSANMKLTPAQVKDILRKTADDIDEKGVDDKTGAGRVNAFRAVQMAKQLG